MKYIKKQSFLSERKFNKTFEDEWIAIPHPPPKFKVGDFVRIVNRSSISNTFPDGWQSEPYEITLVGVNYGTNTEYLLDTIKGGYIWRRETLLELVPDYELASMKYNL